MKTDQSIHFGHNLRLMALSVSLFPRFPFAIFYSNNILYYCSILYADIDYYSALMVLFLLFIMYIKLTNLNLDIVYDNIIILLRTKLCNMIIPLNFT